MSETCVFTLYSTLCINPVNVSDVCHADHFPSLYIAYLIVDPFIPDKLSVCLNVNFIVLGVLVASGACLSGALVSSLIVVVASSDIFSALSTALNLITVFLSTVYVIVPTPLVVVNCLVVHAPFSNHSILSIPEFVSVDFIVIFTWPFVHSPLLGFVTSGVVGFTLSIFTLYILVDVFSALSVVITVNVYSPVYVNVIAS